MIVAGTGHRPNKLGGYHQSAQKRLVDLAEFWLRNVPVKCVISGMALGWDQALVTACLRLSIPYKAYIPFRGQENAWPETSQREYDFMLERASVVVECSEPGYAPWKMQTRNVRMVDDADRILALWDGSSGGTANCVGYANDIKKPITNLWPVYKMIRDVNDLDT